MQIEKFQCTYQYKLKSVCRHTIKTIHFLLFLQTENSHGSAPHEPMVAMLCPGSSGSDGKNRLYHNQYIGADGKWVTDYDYKATCRQDKVEVFEYCKKVYPDKGITNIVELNKFVKISNWCKVGHKKCQGPARKVKPYRCLGESARKP